MWSVADRNVVMRRMTACWVFRKYRGKVFVHEVYAKIRRASILVFVLRKEM
jgi:hypothetical protein